MARHATSGIGTRRHRLRGANLSSLPSRPPRDEMPNEKRRNLLAPLLRDLGTKLSSTKQMLRDRYYGSSSNGKPSLFALVFPSSKPPIRTVSATQRRRLQPYLSALHRLRFVPTWWPMRGPMSHSFIATRPWLADALTLVGMSTVCGCSLALAVFSTASAVGYTLLMTIALTIGAPIASLLVASALFPRGGVMRFRAAVALLPPCWIASVAAVHWKHQRDARRYALSYGERLSNNAYYAPQRQVPRPKSALYLALSAGSSTLGELRDIFLPTPSRLWDDGHPQTMEGDAEPYRTQDEEHRLLLDEAVISPSLALRASTQALLPMSAQRREYSLYTEDVFGDWAGFQHHHLRYHHGDGVTRALSRRHVIDVEERRLRHSSAVAYSDHWLFRECGVSESDHESAVSVLDRLEEGRRAAAVGGGDLFPQIALSLTTPYDYF